MFSCGKVEDNFQLYMGSDTVYGSRVTSMRLSRILMFVTSDIISKVTVVVLLSIRTYIYVLKIFCEDLCSQN